MPQILLIPYHPQQADGYCLAASAQMVLDYLGVQMEQEELARQLEVLPGVGAPAGRITQLSSDVVSVTYDSGDWETIQILLNQKLPIIAMIQAGELSHWQGESFQHAVVVFGSDESRIWIHDPAAPPSPISVSLDEFMLAWSEMDYRYAVIWISN